MHVDKEALIFSSIWHRNRILLCSENIEEANLLFNRFRCYIPQYREMIFCGDIPKTARFIREARLVETDDTPTLNSVLLESLSEEELGTQPVTVVYFNADEKTYKNTLSTLDRGWISTTTVKPSAFEKKPLKIVKKIQIGKVAVLILDPIPTNIFLEKKIIEETIDCSEKVKEYVVQMNESQVHLAFNAILGELEAKNKLTQSYISDTLNIREKTLTKIIEIGKRERRMDILEYIEETPSEIIEFLKGLSIEKEILLAAVFENRDLVGYAKFGDIVFPSRKFLQIDEEIDTISNKDFDLVEGRLVEMRLGNRNIVLYKHQYLFGFVLNSGINPVLLKSKIDTSFNKLESP
jgi:hypothetical protein